MSERFKINRTSVSLLAIVALMGPSVSAIAQTADEIIVTARKKEETLLDAPLAITAFDELELEEAGFKDIIDISKATPGLFIEEFNQSAGRINTTPRFRGVFLATGNRLQQTATVFLDGIYMSGGIQTLGVNELQRVEIIKGPQSALFGRNTFAGAINYVTKDPGDEFRADIDLTAASRGEYGISAGVEGPIADGVSFRLGGMFNTADGHYDNVAVQGQRLGDEEQWAVNGTLLVEPSDSVRVKLRASYREIDDGAPAVQETAGVVFHNFGGFLVTNGNTDLTDSVFPSPGGARTESVFRGTIPTPEADTIGLNSGFDTITALRNAITGDGRFNASTNALSTYAYNPFNVDEFGVKLDSLRLSANAEFDLSEDITFTVLGGYNEEQYGLFTDFDYTRDNSFTAFAAQEIEDFTAEARLSGALLEDKLGWSVGASLTDIEIASNSATANFFGPTIVFGAAFANDRNVTGAQTTGVFGSLDYQLSEEVSVTLEGRYQEDEIQEDGVNAGLPEAISPATIKNFLPRGTLRYEPGDNTTLYATYSEGNLPGGFNPEVGELTSTQFTQLQTLAPDAGITFGEETLKNYELGWKQSIGEGRAGFNLAAFYMQRGDEIFRTIEVVDAIPGSPNPTRTVSFNSNGATTDIKGMEIDGYLDLSDSFTLQGSFAYVDAKIDSFPDGAGSGDFGDIFGPDADVAGQVAPRFPPLSGSITAKLERPFEGIEGFDSWYARGDVYYSGNYWDSNANVAEQDDSVDTNVRAGIRGENVGLEVFVTNLFQEDAPAAAFNFADLSFANRTLPGGFFNFGREGAQVALRDKRQVGVRAKYTFR